MTTRSAVSRTARAASALVLLPALGCAGFGPTPRCPTLIPGPAGLLHVDDGGTGGVPVVFVHSFAGGSEHWREQLAHLRRTRRGVALDLRAHGRSAPARDNAYAIASLAGDIAAVANALGLERFVLVGHSMGGAASLAYAGAHPERVAGLVLVGAPGKIPPEQAQRVMASLQADYEGVMSAYWDSLLTGAQPHVAARIRSERQRLSPAVSLGLIQATFDYDPLPALQRYRGPKLAIVTPDQDKPYELHRLVEDLPHRTVTGTSHWLQMDKPEEFNRLLDEFLETIVR